MGPKTPACRQLASGRLPMTDERRFAALWLAMVVFVALLTLAVWGWHL